MKDELDSRPRMHRLKSQAGVTLVELMIAVFTGGLLLVTAMGVLLNVSGTSSNFTLSLDTEIEELGAVNALQLVFSQATELKYNDSALRNTYTNANGKGALLGAYDSDADFGVTPVSTLAVFMRDRQISSLTSPSTLASDLKPTAVFFQAPTPTTFGVLYIALDQPLAPRRSQLAFDGLVRVQVLSVSTFQQPGAAPVFDAPVTSFDMVLTFRRFLGAVPPNKRMFCPAPSALAACPGIGAFHDVSRRFKITVRDNILELSSTAPDIIPARPTPGSRIFDLIHFFVLGHSGALQ